MLVFHFYRKMSIIKMLPVHVCVWNYISHKNRKCTLFALDDIFEKYGPELYICIYLPMSLECAYLILWWIYIGSVCQVSEVVKLVEIALTNWNWNACGLQVRKECELLAGCFSSRDAAKEKFTLLEKLREEKGILQRRVSTFLPIFPTFLVIVSH